MPLPAWLDHRPGAILYSFTWVKVIIAQGAILYSFNWVKVIIAQVQYCTVLPGSTGSLSKCNNVLFYLGVADHRQGAMMYSFTWVKGIIVPVQY